MSVWEEDNTTLLGLKANFAPYCIFHPNKPTMMVLHDAKMLAFSLRQDEDWDSRAMDVVLRCPHCGYMDIYGVAISREHWEKTRKVFHKQAEENGYVAYNRARTEEQKQE